MKHWLPLTVAALVVLLAGTAWSEDTPAEAAERAQLIEQGRRLVEQGSVDYERMQEALTKLEAEKARMESSGASLAAMDQLAKRAQALQAAMRELQKARSRLRDAKSRLDHGRLDAAKQVFNEAASRWAEVHKLVVQHLGPAPTSVRPIPAVGSTAGNDVNALRREVQTLRQELQSLRAQVQALQAETRELRALLQQRDGR